MPRESGVIGIDEPIDLVVERQLRRHHLEDAGTNDEAIRSQTARARSAFDRKW